MDFAASAGKHGVTEEDVRHALRNALFFGEQEFDGELRRLVIGPDVRGGLLELVLVPSSTPSLVIHADRLRPKFYVLLRG